MVCLRTLCWDMSLLHHCELSRVLINPTLSQTVINASIPTRNCRHTITKPYARCEHTLPVCKCIKWATMQIPTIAMVCDEGSPGNTSAHCCTHVNFSYEEKVLVHLMHVLRSDPSDSGQQGQAMNSVLWVTASKDNTDTTKAADRPYLRYLYHIRREFCEAQHFPVGQKIHIHGTWFLN